MIDNLDCDHRRLGMFGALGRRCEDEGLDGQLSLLEKKNINECRSLNKLVSPVQIEPVVGLVLVFVVAMRFESIVEGQINRSACNP